MSPHSSTRHTVQVWTTPSRIEVGGEIDAAAVFDLDRFWTIVDGAEPIELDMSTVTFCSAAAIGRLVAWSRRCGGPIRIVASWPVEHLLAICGIDGRSLSRVRPVELVPVGSVGVAATPAMA